ncbi:phosphate/phosphite/phosphonate ABC transporter substrate-binding protein [Salipaludibacillus daqingensis]|uniref:phosphate/phosphite/phosphonate ABC transporter substrate-binding protein n=1 Tax=Salipaludibacillus daqingensis TaxID=3041001 RepID=UPI002476D33D|nr:phosphate/phosphite/phosphonate ABC transporter substrate-binding protein [Salipaludibacillus daqingensis]
MMWNKVTYFIIGMLTISIVISGCSLSEKSFAELKISNDVQQKEVFIDGYSDSNEEALKFAVVSILSLSETQRTYQPFIEYLEHELDRPVKIIQKQTYGEVRALFEEGKVDAGIVCAYLAVIGENKEIMKGITTPIKEDSSTFTSYIIVNESSEAESLSDLQGKSMAFSDPLSYSGYLYAEYETFSAGYELDEFFGSTHFTYSHDNTIKSVSKGLVEAGATHSGVFDELKNQNNPIVDNIKIIEKGPYVGNSPVIINPDIDETLKKDLEKTILTMHEDPSGEEALKLLGIMGFEPFNRDLFNPIQEMKDDLEQ